MPSLKQSIAVMLTSFAPGDIFKGFVLYDKCTDLDPGTPTYFFMIQEDANGQQGLNPCKTAQSLTLGDTAIPTELEVAGVYKLDFSKFPATPTVRYYEDDACSTEIPGGPYDLGTCGTFRAGRRYSYEENSLNAVTALVSVTHFTNTNCQGANDLQGVVGIGVCGSDAFNSYLNDARVLIEDDNMVRVYGYASRDNSCSGESTYMTELGRVNSWTAPGDCTALDLTQSVALYNVASSTGTNPPTLAPTTKEPSVPPSPESGGDPLPPSRSPTAVTSKPTSNSPTSSPTQVTSQPSPDSGLDPLPTSSNGPTQSPIPSTNSPTAPTTQSPTAPTKSPTAPTTQSPTTPTSSPTTGSPTPPTTFSPTPSFTRHRSDAGNRESARGVMIILATCFAMMVVAFAG